MKKTKLILLLLLLTFVSNCSTPVKVTKTENFDPNASITIVAENDPLGIQSKLEHLFLTKGFEVISEATAQKKIKYHQEIKSDSNKIENKGEVSSVQEINSVYALKFQYTSRMDFPAGQVFSSFNASVIRLVDGQLVATTSFSQGQWTGKKIDKVLESFVNELVK
jgi:hypothetical protein